MPLLLIVDTSGKDGSLALAQATPSSATEIEIQATIPISGGTFSAQLIPQIAALLETCGYAKKDLDAFVVINGPGSFTGLRVGLVAVKALSEALQKPIAAVSLLEAIAASVPNRLRVLAALDAGRNEVYVGDYEVSEPPKKNSERLWSREELAGEAKTHSIPITTPDEVLADFFRSRGMKVEQIDRPGSKILATLGWLHLQRNETVPADQLDANYVRNTDAELFAKPSR